MVEVLPATAGKLRFSAIGAKNRSSREDHPKGRSAAEEARSALNFARTEVTALGESVIEGVSWVSSVGRCVQVGS